MTQHGIWLGLFMGHTVLKADKYPAWIQGIENFSNNPIDGSEKDLLICDPRNISTERCVQI
jgi:hypothetical protein